MLLPKGWRGSIPFTYFRSKHASQYMNCCLQTSKDQQYTSVFVRIYFNVEICKKEVIHKKYFQKQKEGKKEREQKKGKKLTRNQFKEVIYILETRPKKSRMGDKITLIAITISKFTKVNLNISSFTPRFNVLKMFCEEQNVNIPNLLSKTLHFITKKD